MPDDVREPILVLSQDYELFFGDSGSVENCLLRPTQLLLDYGRRSGVQITFFVDAGMLAAFDRHAGSSPGLQRAADTVRRNLEEVAAAGHEIGLHVHPHWEDTRWQDERWDFSATRYQLRDFDDDEIEDIFRRYHGLLQALTPDPVQSYRAGGFCVEPFGRIAGVMRELGVTIESSVVPGAALVDPDKGFDFADLPDAPWWFFSDTPARPLPDGEFIEIPVTPCRLTRGYYWGRLARRLQSRLQGPGAGSSQAGDGRSKAIGRTEVLRRLFGRSLVSELSVDAAKAPVLGRPEIRGQRRRCWHVMGHPKLLSAEALDELEAFRAAQGIATSLGVTALAQRLRG